MAHVYRIPSRVPTFPRSYFVPGAPPPEVPNVGMRFPIVEAIPPTPFPGQVIFYRNPYGTPPDSVAPSALFQTQVSTPSPPPYMGGVIAIRPAMGETPVAPQPRIEPAVGPMNPPFPGAVITAQSNSGFGISALPARPVHVSTPSPPPFMGGVITNVPRDEEERIPPLVSAVIREAPSVPEFAQPIAWRGVPPRDAPHNLTTVAIQATADSFPGEVLFNRVASGLSPLPAVRPKPIQIEASSVEPGRVVVSAGRVQEQILPVRPSVIRQEASDNALSQPIAWRGVPPRDAPHGTKTFVSIAPENAFPGEAHYHRVTSGLSPLPARPTLAQMAEGTSVVEPGRVEFVSKTPTAPVLPPQSVVIRSDSVAFMGGVIHSRGEAAPSVYVRPSIIYGDTSYPDVIQPTFVFRVGFGSPTTPGAGYPVTLYGTDTSVITLTALDGCDC